MSLSMEAWLLFSDSIIFFYGLILAHFTLFSSKLSLYMSIVKTQNLVFVRDFALKTILQYSLMVCNDKSNWFWLIWLVLKKGTFFPNVEKNVTKTSECVLCAFFSYVFYQLFKVTLFRIHYSRLSILCQFSDTKVDW